MFLPLFYNFNRLITILIKISKVSADFPQNGPLVEQNSYSTLYNNDRIIFTDLLLTLIL